MTTKPIILVSQAPLDDEGKPDAARLETLFAQRPDESRCTLLTLAAPDGRPIAGIAFPGDHQELVILTNDQDGKAAMRIEITPRGSVVVTPYEVANGKPPIPLPSDN